MTTIGLYQSATYGGYAIVALTDGVEDGRQLYIGTDYDFPGVASTFGWYIGSVDVEGVRFATPDDPGASAVGACDHDGTDGTITCPGCGLTASTFIAAARDWLDEHVGDTAEDPGYFTEEDQS